MLSFLSVARDSRDVLMTRLTLKVVNEKENETVTYYVVSGLICIQSSLLSFLLFWFLQYARRPHPFSPPSVGSFRNKFAQPCALKIFLYWFPFSFSSGCSLLSLASNSSLSPLFNHDFPFFAAPAFSYKSTPSSIVFTVPSWFSERCPSVLVTTTLTPRPPRPP